MCRDIHRKNHWKFCDFAEQKQINYWFVYYKKTIVFLDLLEYDNYKDKGELM